MFGSNSKLKPLLNVSVKSVLIEQLEEIRLLGVILDSRLMWSKQIENMVLLMGRGLSVIKRCAHFYHSFASLKLCKQWFLLI